MTLPGGSTDAKFQCPKCLAVITLPKEPHPRPEEPPPAPPSSTTAELAERLQLLEQQQDRVASLITDMEILTSENTALRATVEGLQTERAALLRQIDEYVRQIESLESAQRGPPPPPESAPASDDDAIRLLNNRLAAARGALEETAQSVLKIVAVEQQVFDLGAQLLRASCRVTELEEEIGRLRDGH